MNEMHHPLQPEPPFVWPEPRVVNQSCSYENEPAFEAVARASDSVFGVVSALGGKGLEVLESWLKGNANFQARLIVAVYPTCLTRRDDLVLLQDATERHGDRLTVHIRPCQWVTDRPTNALCFVEKESGVVHVVTGPTESLGFDPRRDGKVNFVFRAEPALVKSFEDWFTWLWGNSQEISTEGVTQIPDLVLPSGSAEGERLWREYSNLFDDDSRADISPRELVQVDPETGDVTLVSADGASIMRPTEAIGLPKLDRLAENVARLYAKGVLISVDKLSRIPPLDAPLDPSWFGDRPEMQRGNVTRKVSMRVRIIDESTLKEIDKRRKALHTLLGKFAFGLADKMRWMPHSAKALFESELERVNAEGQKLISDLLKGDIASFIAQKKDTLVVGINAMYRELGRQGSVTEDVIGRVVDNLKERLTKAQSANFMPKLTYSHITFSVTEDTWASPWGQAYSLMSDIAVFPRKALTDRFFFSGLKVSEDDLMEAMNVMEDAIVRDRSVSRIKDRCKTELDLLVRIEKSSIDAREKCDLLWRMLIGGGVDSITAELDERESKEKS
jgi:hypothetical protein